MVSAATPATCGAAIEVPENVTPPEPVPTAVENTETPGAVTLGFSAPSPVRGPPEEKLAASRKDAFASGLAVTDAVVAVAAPINVAVSLFSSSMKGIVIPSMKGLKNPAPLLTTPIATAPAAIAFCPFWTKLHEPRDTITTAPAAPVAG